MYDKKRRMIKYTAAVFVLAVLVEIFICNYQFFITPGNGKYTVPEINADNLFGFEEHDDGYISTRNDLQIEFDGINAPIKTVGLHVEFVDGYKFGYEMDFTDSSNSNYRLRQGLIQGNVVSGSKESEIVYIQTSGDVGKLKIDISLPDDTVILMSDSSVSFNEKVPFTFNILRPIILLSAVYLLMFLLCSDICKKSISALEKTTNSTAYAAGIVCVLIAFALCVPSSNGLIYDFTMKSGDQITKELVDAFKCGQVQLLRPVEPELLALDNPYDWSQRLEADISYAWDHVMYEGNYYSYYGIAPVILLFLPYHLLTGYYFPTVWAVFIFGAMGLVFLCLAYKAFIKRMFPDLPYGMYLSGLLIAVASCGAWFCFMTPNFYEIAQNSGFAFVTLGAYLLFASGVLFAKERVSYIRLILSSASLATAVLCRPTTAVWCIGAVAMIIYGFILRVKSMTSGKKIAYILSGAVPYAVIGSVQMIYNYVRFGSVLDFGIQYSLTVNDFTTSEFSVNMALIGFYDYLLAFPIINDVFPFIHSNFSDLGINGYYFIANRTCIGLLFRALPVFGVFAAPKVFMGMEKKKRIFPCAIWVLCTLVLPAAAIFSIWESGYGVRYCVDFSWQILLGALTVLFILYRKGAGGIYKFITVSVLPALTLCITMGLEYMSSCSYFAHAYDILKISAEFWR